MYVVEKQKTKTQKQNALLCVFVVVSLDDAKKRKKLETKKKKEC